MFEISATTALMLYLGTTLGAILGLWGCQHYKRRHAKINPARQVLFVCEYCHFAYLDDLDKTVTQCAQCQSFNKFRKLS